MKKIVLTGLFVFGLMFVGASINAMGGGIHLAGKDGITNQLRYTQTLRRGSRNANVLALQKKLKEFGFYHKALDSDYGSGTIAAVKQFQRTKGLKVDGIAGPKTYAMILATQSIPKIGGLKDDSMNVISVCTKEYKPVCGQVDICDGREICPAIYVLHKTFSNTCMAKLAHAKILYKGICKTNILQINGEPIVETNLVSYITDESAKLHGEVDLNGQDEIEAFFVYGQSFGKIQDVPSIYDSYSQIVEQGDSIQKEYVGDVEEDDDEDFQKEVDNLHAGEGYYYRACVEFETLVEEDEKLTCGEIKKFETLGGDGNLDKCLEIVTDSYGGIGNNANVHYGNLTHHKLVGQFNVYNRCDHVIYLDNIYFDVTSSLNKAPFKNMSVIMEGVPSLDDTDDIVSIHTINGFGKNLSFESSFDNYIIPVMGNDDRSIDVYADIFANYSSQTGLPYHSAFAIGIKDVKYHYNNQYDGYINEPTVWGKLIVLDNI